MAEEIELADSSDVPIPLLDWEERSDWVNVQELGAAGDGEADDTAAIQEALNSIRNGETVYLPAGDYRVTDTLRLARGRRMQSVMFVGHGRGTRLLWDGEEGGAIFHPDGVAYARFVGLVFDGRGRAGVGIMNRNRFFETESRHQYLAFLNFTDAGFLVHPERRQAVSEPSFEGCYFENNRRGIAFLRHNDYNFAIIGCEFRDNDIGVDCNNGQFLLRNSHFTGSRKVDIRANPHHASSIRRTTSIGSAAFVHFTADAGPLALEDVHVDGWTDDDGAVVLNGAPVMLFNSSFSGGPENMAPIRLEKSEQRLIVSNVEGPEGGLYKSADTGHIYEVPAGERGPVVGSASRRFLPSEVAVPGKVFDAKRDFGAAADGRADDTEAVQEAIDAAREHGEGALAYLPTGAYRITETLRISGSDYYVGGGGSGFDTHLRWDGEEGGTLVHMDSPQDITLKYLSIGHHNAGRMDNAVDVLYTSDGNGSSAVYDGVWAFGVYQQEPEKQGMHFVGLDENDEVYIRHAQGNLQVRESSRATIVGSVVHEGSMIVAGPENDPGAGLLGIIVRLSTIAPQTLYVHDNNSMVFSDFYNEQSQGMFHIAGSADAPAGRITWTGGRSHVARDANEPTMSVDNYHGEIFIGGKDFSDYRWAEDAQKRQMRQTGEAPVHAFLFGNLLFGSHFHPSGEDNFHWSLIGNESLEYPPSVRREGHQRYIPEDRYADEDLEALSRAFDDLSRLGAYDLRMGPWKD